MRPHLDPPLRGEEIFLPIIERGEATLPSPSKEGVAEGDSGMRRDYREGRVA
jgi:hypothetical protein